MFDDFYGNAEAVRTIEQMILSGRIPQTLLVDGPAGIGKATLARRLASRLLGDTARIENDDLSLAHNADLLAEREKLAPDKRAEDPFLLATHPDFVTFAPDGPLRQLSIQQMRLLRDRAQFGPLSGRYRVFLIDSIDRANEQAANSLLKTLEEPPPYLILVLTAENCYDLLPTIRSRAVPIRLARLDDQAMAEFAASRRLDDAARRVALADGCPGLAVSFDLAAYDKRREAMLALVETAAGAAPFSRWAVQSEKIAQLRSEKLEAYLLVLYYLLEDLLHLGHGVGRVRNIDLRERLAGLAGSLNFGWLQAALARTDRLMSLLRRNIQKNIALDALVVELRSLAGVA